MKKIILLSFFFTLLLAIGVTATTKLYLVNQEGGSFFVHSFTGNNLFNVILSTEIQGNVDIFIDGEKIADNVFGLFFECVDDENCEVQTTEGSTLATNNNLVIANAAVIGSDGFIVLEDCVNTGSSVLCESEPIIFSEFEINVLQSEEAGFTPECTVETGVVLSIPRPGSVTYSVSGTPVVTWIRTTTTPVPVWANIKAESGFEIYNGGCSAALSVGPFVPSFGIIGSPASALCARHISSGDLLELSPVVYSDSAITAPFTRTISFSVTGTGQFCPVVAVCGNGAVETGEQCDDGDVFVPQSCGVGACLRSVADTCVNSGAVNECTSVACVPGTPVLEVCNGVDDDCDGFTDELGPGTDSDGDGLACADDACPNSAGSFQGCPVGDRNVVELHTVNIGGGSSSKVPLANAEVRVFDRNSADFQGVAGSKNPNGDLYGVIFEADQGRVGSCITDLSGVCIAGEAFVGDYLVVVRYLDPATGKTVYVGRPKSPGDFVSLDGYGGGLLATKDFQIIKVFKKGVFQEYRGGSKIVVTGSLLEVILPETAVWEGSQSIYPFIFTSDSSWSVDVCAEVPQGYNIVGAYDADGNLQQSSDCVQALVAGVTKVIAFEVFETGSPEPSLKATIKVKGPNGKSVVKQHVAKDIRKQTFNAKVAQAKSKARGRDVTGAAINGLDANGGFGIAAVLALVALAVFLARKPGK